MTLNLWRKSETVVFPKDGHRSDGTATGYVLSETDARQLLQSFSNAAFYDTHQWGHRKHIHFTDGGPTTEYIIAQRNVLALCERLPIHPPYDFFCVDAHKN